MNLINRTILVTGGTSGIGFAFAKRFLEMGNTVIITGRSQERIDQAVKNNPGLIGLAADVSDPISVDQLAQELAIHYPKLDIVFNNAGIMHEFDLFDENITYEHLAAEINTNLNGTIYVTKALLPLLAKQQEAMIVNVSSLLANITVANAPAYSATKAGVHMFSDALREQIRAKGKKIHVMELCPPVISETNLTDTYDEGFLNKMISLPLAKLVNAGITGMEKNKLRVNAGFTKVMRFSMKFAPDFITHTWGQMILKAK
ncbi:SDR family oxidoreductase [Paenibacillus sp. P32E]|uniref:SDR family oxidoreductase n=1 Tax=Paenibacillus sp. P32E TaxID=1349434 RepID=UPI000938FDC5|nr:SDR family NAD(P)-dependent oxidoreductase [Paenibacillus sp. P32E]OKP93363.1 oxidoreductase [Paenibacillus sp. P32E]